MSTRTTPGERKLPGGRIGIAAAAVVLASAACAPQAVSAPATLAPPPTANFAQSPVPSPATPTASFTIPTLGTTPPSGLVLPTYFVTLTGSKNGAVGVLTTPGSSCTLSVKAPSGTSSDYPAQIVGADGTTQFTYPPVTGHGESIQTVRCTLGAQDQTAKGQVLLP